MLLTFASTRSNPPATYIAAFLRRFIKSILPPLVVQTSGVKTLSWSTDCIPLTLLMSKPFWSEFISVKRKTPVNVPPERGKYVLLILSSLALSSAVITPADSIVAFGNSVPSAVPSIY